MADPVARRAKLAHWYDLDLAGEEADLDMYLALAHANQGPVLELAAGTGRICLPLAEAGHTVTGVDRDAQMLERARARWLDRPGSRPREAGSLELVEADITELDLGRHFGLVILALNTLLLLPGREAQRAALAAMARHLAPEGRAVLDIWLPTPDDLALYDGRLTLDWLRRDPVSGWPAAKSFSAWHDPARATARVVTIFDSWPAGGGALSRIAREDELWLLSSHELLGLAGESGLVPEVVAGDYGLGPFGTGSERMVLVCRLL